MPSETYNRNRRQQAIRAILNEREISSQGEIVSQLAARGIPATQSSVSRDLRELDVIKRAGHYTFPDRPRPAMREFEGPRILAENLRSIQPAGANMLVVRTVVGGASRVALALDREELDCIVGTIAGDDTVFIATESARQQRELTAFIDRLLAHSE